MRRTPTAVLISGGGSNLQALLDAQAHGAAYDIRLVIANRADAGGLDRAVRAGVEAVLIEHRPFGQDRAAFEAAVQACLEEQAIEFVALAGFMRVLTSGFVHAWAGRMVNIHPSLLPLFPGLDTHARALAAGVRLHGCTVHYVTEGVDQGAIIGQAAVPVRPDDSPEALQARVLAAEHQLYPLCLDLAVAGRDRPARGFGPPAGQAMMLNGFLNY